MINKKISFGVVVGGLSIAASSLSGLIIYPLLLKTLSKEIAGLWFFYTSLTVIITLGQAGLAPIVMRRAAKVIIGKQNKEFSDFYVLIQKSYIIVSLFVLFICSLLYVFYVQKVLKENIELFNEGLIAWILFVVGNLITIYNSKNFLIINGFGEVGWDKVAQIINTILMIAGYFLVLWNGFGLIGLSVVFFISSLTNAFASQILLNKFFPLNITNDKGKASNNEIIEIFKEGSQILILNIVGILVMNKDVFFVERFLSLSIVPSFSALNRIQGIVISISLLIPQMIFPFISQNMALNNFKVVKKLYWQGVLFSITIAFVLSSVLLIFGNIIFPLWLGSSNYLGNKILFLLLFIGLISIHHNAHASAVLSTGKNSFLWPAVINVILSLPFAYFGVKYFGIEGMIVGNIIATIFPSIFVVNYSIRFFNNLAK